MAATTIAVGQALKFRSWSGGRYQIIGTVKKASLPDNIPVARRVAVHFQGSGYPLDAVWSDPVTGAYAFRGIVKKKCYVVAFDHTGLDGGVTETDIIPEPMP